jgi:hypothetical protein
MSTTNVESDFWERLADAFGTPEVGKIARKLGVPYQTVKNYSEGRLPSADILVSISDVTQVSIHWLLTGAGPGRVPTVEGRAVDHDAPRRLLNEAESLAERGFARGSALVVGVALDLALRQLLPVPGERTQSVQQLALREVTSLLLRNGLISAQDQRKLTFCSIIRERAAHSREEPTEESVRLMIVYGRRIIGRHAESATGPGAASQARGKSAKKPPTPVSR